MLPISDLETNNTVLVTKRHEKRKILHQQIGSFFFLPPPKTWILPFFLHFFENRRNYAISMVHNVFQGHLEVAEHVFDIIFMFHHVFDSVSHEK